MPFFDDYDGVIFFDIDGVANRHAHVEEVLTSSGITRSEDEIRSLGVHLLEPIYVERVDALCHATRARLVITSSWRHRCSLELIRSVFEARGFPPGLIRDSVPYDAWEGDRRAENTLRWLEKNPTSRFVILDDDWTGWGRWVREEGPPPRRFYFVPDAPWEKTFLRVKDGFSSEEAACAAEILKAVKTT